MKPAIGDLVRGKYRVQRLIGDGGMGSVFEARHEALNTEVALKFLHSDLAKRPGLSARFAREARVAAAIQSPHVTRVNDVDTTEDGTPFIVMELLQGQSLASVLSKEPAGRLNLEESVDFALQILAGLEAAHARGVVHRDLKPDNVFVTPSPGGPVVKLFDFGIAKIRESKEFNRGLTHAGILMGTPEYMAPEQLYSAAGVDHRADLYSLGVMLFEMLSGQLPAEGESAAAIVAQAQQGTARRLDELLPDLQKDCVAIVHAALAPDPSQRFESAFAMRQALAPFATNLSHAGMLAASRTSITTPPQPATSMAASVVAQAMGPAVAPPPGVLPDTVPPEQSGPSTTERPADPARPATVLTPSPPGAFAPLGASSPFLAQQSTAPVMRPPKRSGALPWTLGSLALVLGGAIGVIAHFEHNDRSTTAPSTSPAFGAPSAQAPTPEIDPPTQSAKGSSVESSAAETPTAAQSSTPQPTTTSQPATHQKPPARGTGGTSQGPGNETDQNVPAPFGIPLPFPSNFPPLPSTLPPLPESLTSALPTSFPPIFQPPSETPEQQEK